MLCGVPDLSKFNKGHLYSVFSVDSSRPCGDQETNQTVQGIFEKLSKILYLHDEETTERT